MYPFDKIRMLAAFVPVTLAILVTPFPAAGQVDEGFDVLEPTEVIGVPPAFAPVAGGEAIFGDVAEAFNAPGSGTLLNNNDITYQSYNDVNRVLRKAPGVYLREEDGYGNFPNISLRGVDTTRSAKITIMEDGVLTPPAPYSAPSAYYFPNVGRMNAVEVYKGHSQILFGPHTTGGAINFLSTPIPSRDAAYVRALYGTNNEFRIHAWMGDTVHTKVGRVGFLLEGFLRETDGFKHIQETPDFRRPDSLDTGFSRREPMMKFFWEPNTPVYQRVEFKSGYTAFDANESYLGLSEADIRTNPDLRYAASRFDNFGSTHARNYLRWIIGDPEKDCCSFISTVYYNNFHRNWFKLHDIRGVDITGGGAAAIDGSERSTLSGALAGGPTVNGGTATPGTAGMALEVLQGARAGTLRNRNNNREYYLYGYEGVYKREFCSAWAHHDVSAGFRYHVDQVRRFQTDEFFTQDTNGTIVDRTVGTPGGGGDRRQRTEATAFYLQDRIDYGRLAVVPGIRFEHLFQTSETDGASDGSATLDLAGGGVGLTYELNSRLQMIGGFHRGFSPPNPRGRVRGGLSEEEALASEFGLRYLNPEFAFATQMIGFYTHFNDLLVIDNIGGTGTGETENVGEVYSGGVEFTAQYDMGIDHGWGFRNPWFATLTWTDARVLGTSASADPESIFAGAFPGAKVPYIPEWQFGIGTGLHFGCFGTDITGYYVDSTFTTASNADDQINPVSGLPDSRFGTTDAASIWDWSAYANLNRKWKVFGGIQNVFDHTYIVSRHPHGPRPNKPLFGYMGAEVIY